VVTITVLLRMAEIMISIVMNLILGFCRPQRKRGPTISCWANYRYTCVYTVDAQHLLMATVNEGPTLFPGWDRAGWDGTIVENTCT